LKRVTVTLKSLAMASDSLDKTLAALFVESMRGYGEDCTEAQALEALSAVRVNMHLFAYVPFDAEKIRKLMHRAANRAGKTDKEFKDDIRLMLVIYVIQGASITKAMPRMNNVRIAQIQPLIHRYSIVDSVRNRPSTFITLDRVAAAFPLYTMCNAFAAGELLLKFGGFTNCPPAQVTAWAAFAVDEDDWVVAFTCAYRNYLATNRQANGHTPERRIETVRPYIRAIVKGNRITDEQKTFLNLEIGIYVKQDGEVQKSASFKELLKEVLNYVDSNGLVIPKKDN
jgi:Tenuivirus/Phlebovirus nucleocapsid protein